MEAEDLINVLQGEVKQTNNELAQYRIQEERWISEVNENLENIKRFQEEQD